MLKVFTGSFLPPMLEKENWSKLMTFSSLQLQEQTEFTTKTQKNPQVLINLMVFVISSSNKSTAFIKCEASID